MAEITKPIALDETFNTTSSPSQNIADVLKGGLYDIAQAVGSGSSVSWNQIQASGDKIAEVTINGTTTDVYSPSVSGKADNSIIAPVLTTFQATATVKDKGTQFIYNGVLYEITTTVTAGTSFVVGTNVKVADTVIEQIQHEEYIADLTTTAQSFERKAKYKQYKLTVDISGFIEDKYAPNNSLYVFQSFFLSTSNYISLEIDIHATSLKYTILGGAGSLYSGVRSIKLYGIY